MFINIGLCCYSLFTGRLSIFVLINRSTSKFHFIIIYCMNIPSLNKVLQNNRVSLQLILFILVTITT